MRYFIFICLSTVVLSCQSNNDSKQQLIDLDTEARQYFFMPDSVKVNSKITDTIYHSELITQEKELDDEIAKAQHQIDTLQLYIDLWENKMFDLMDNKAPDCEINQAKLLHTTYQLSQNEYKMQKMELRNTSRILLGLKRQAKDSIMGYETDVTYFMNDNANTLHVLMNANFKIVD